MAQIDLPPALKVRAVRVITQTITRALTTITTLVTLGDPTAAMDIAQPTDEPPPPPPPAAAPAAALPPAPSSGTLSPEQLGALLGSVLGFAFLVLVICCCFSCHRRRPQEPRFVFDGTSSEYSGSRSENEVTREYYTSTRDWNRMRGPGGVGIANVESMVGGSGSMPRRPGAGFTVVPPPARFPPTPRYTPYQQSRWPQISGVRRFP
ncbi:hypothetical protein QBC40DRAFT_263573 [Triangularia verruculosa]|uniref:Uncharacterized protein n=1 Tax=Triangularia verruculosa TaxID=2587418 RepID=A0AAN6XPA5_9PEZI|nr:hypothetical protein QBC40DRAFT_263573 [Triangularia verruculosa]